MVRPPSKSAETSEHDQFVFGPADLDPERGGLLEYAPQPGPSLRYRHRRKARIDKLYKLCSPTPNELDTADFQNLPVFSFTRIHGSEFNSLFVLLTRQGFPIHLVDLAKPHGPAVVLTKTF